LVKYTYFGDVNFDGVVNAADYAIIDNGFNFQNDPAVGASLRNWANGDMNFDGAINAADYALIDNAFNFQSGPLAGTAPVAAAGDAPELAATAWTPVAPAPALQVARPSQVDAFDVLASASAWWTDDDGGAVIDALDWGGAGASLIGRKRPGVLEALQPDTSVKELVGV
jgi:hypothetical protein